MIKQLVNRNQISLLFQFMLEQFTEFMVLLLITVIAVVVPLEEIHHVIELITYSDSTAASSSFVVATVVAARIQGHAFKDLVPYSFHASSNSFD